VHVNKKRSYIRIRDYRRGAAPAAPAKRRSSPERCFMVGALHLSARARRGAPKNHGRLRPNLLVGFWAHAQNAAVRTLPGCAEYAIFYDVVIHAKDALVRAN
jgi:hypothetical protein